MPQLVADPGFPWRGGGNNPIITVYISSCGKVMFSQACVKISVHEGRMHGRGACMAGGVNIRGMHGRGECMAGGMHGREGACVTRGCVAGGCVAGRYVSYWNAFLFGQMFIENCMKMKEI